MGGGTGIVGAIVAPRPGAAFLHFLVTVEIWESRGSSDGIRIH